MKRIAISITVTLLIFMSISMVAFAESISDNITEPPGDAESPSASLQHEVFEAIEIGLVPESLDLNYSQEIKRGEVAQLFINLLEMSTGRTIEGVLSIKQVTINPDAFTDTNDSYVLAANALGIINGIGNNRFDPEGTLTRSQIAAIVNREAKVLGIETSFYTHSFTDVSDHWVDAELGWPASAGIINGIGDNKFDPDSPLTTEQAIAITYRALVKLIDYSSVGFDQRDADNWINLSELSDEFIAKYLIEYAEMRDNSDPDNILTVMSHGRPRDYGAERVVEAPNNTWYLQYATAEERDAAYEKLSLDRKIIVERNGVSYPLTNGEPIYPDTDSIPLMDGDPTGIEDDHTNLQLSHWASGYIIYVKENALMQGMEDGNFHPEEALTEAQCCQILANINGEVSKAVEDEAWYAPAVAFVEGRTGLTIRPEAEATREFLCRLFYWYEIENPRVTFYGLGEMPFTDCGELGVESKNAIRFCVRNDIVCGFPDGTFRPDESLTRAQGAKVFSVLYDYYEDEMAAEEQAAWSSDEELTTYAEELGLTVDVYSVRNDTEFYRCIQVYAVRGDIEYMTWGKDEPTNEAYVARQFLISADGIYEMMSDGSTTEMRTKEAKNLVKQTADTMEFWQKAIAAAEHMKDFAVNLGWSNYEFFNDTGIFSDGTYWARLNIGRTSQLLLSPGGYGSGPIVYCIINGGCHSVPRAEVELWLKANPQEPLA